MEFKELAQELGAQNIIVTHFNNVYYKNVVTVIIDSDLTIYVCGKTMYPIPTSVNGINKTVSKGLVNRICAAIDKELNGKSI